MSAHLVRGYRVIVRVRVRVKFRVRVRVRVAARARVSRVAIGGGERPPVPAADFVTM